MKYINLVGCYLLTPNRLKSGTKTDESCLKLVILIV